MKYCKIFSILLALILVLSFPAAVYATENESTPSEDQTAVDIAPVAADSGFTGLVRYKVKSSLGEIILLLPDGLDNSVLQYRDGYLYNVSGSTIYLYCEEYPNYTFSASRFSPVSYRVSNGYDTVQLSVSEVLTYSASPDQLWDYLLYFLLILIVFLLFWRRSK